MQELVIEKVRQCEYLYNVHSPDYRDQKKRSEAWEQIGRDLRITGSEARDIWSKLRNCFSNALKRRNLKKRGQAAKKYIPWKFEKRMLFLEPYIDFKQTHSNLPECEESAQLSEVCDQMKEEEVDNFVDETHELEVEEYSSVSSPSTSYIESTSGLKSRSQQLPKRLKPENPVEEIHITRQNSEVRMHATDHKFSGNLNETDMFYLSMSKTIQKLPQIDQIRIRMELCKLVSEAEMRQIQGPTEIPTPQHSQIFPC